MMSFAAVFRGGKLEEMERGEPAWEVSAQDPHNKNSYFEVGITEDVARSGDVIQGFDEDGKLVETHLAIKSEPTNITISGMFAYQVPEIMTYVELEEGMSSPILRMVKVLDAAAKLETDGNGAVDPYSSDNAERLAQIVKVARIITSSGPDEGVSPAL